MGKLDGKAVIVTGAGRGLGRGISLRLGHEGAKVFTMGRTKETLDQWARDMDDRGYKCGYITGDCASREDCERLVAAAIDAFEQVDALVNNAIAMPVSSVQDLDDETFDVVWGSGLKGSLYLMQACYPHFKAQGHGKVVNFTSQAATFGNVNRAPYSMTKAALAGLTRVAAVEWGRDNIQVNALSPSAADPDTWPEFEAMMPERLNEFTKSMWPEGKLAVNYETHIGSVVAFLVGDDSDWVTSRTVFADGGQGSWR